MAKVRAWSELADGDEFAGYRIQGRLGRGGMGILYLALEPGLERRVALKLIAPEAAADPVFARRFAEESRIAAAIEHPNVVPIYAAGEEEGVPWIAMRYVAGSDLGRRIARRGRLDPPEAVGMIAQIGNGLDAIHAAGLIHRDVKPANVLLGGEEPSLHAYITDFGVAREVAEESGLTRTGRFVGTLDYVAPEQISGEPADARVDVYALGCLLFKLLTGEVPFPREGEAARLYAHLHDPPPAPSLYAPEVSPALDEVAVRAMSKSPDDRHPSAGDLGRAAQAALSGAPVAVPERTVATGAAATRERQAPRRGGGPASEAPTGRAAQPAAGGGSSSEAATGRLPDERRAARRRGLWVAIAALSLVGAGLLAVLPGSGGSGSGGETAGAQAGKGAKPGRRGQGAAPATLSAAALIAGGDAICADSQATYRAYRDEFPAGESEASVGYSRLLVGISAKAVRRFSRLRPPPALKRDYEAYAAAQEQVARWDEEALAAAERGDLAAYRAARARRDGTEAERQALAEAVGFHVCSGSEA